MLWTNLLLGLVFAFSSVQPVGAEGRPGCRVGDGRESFLLGICKLVGSVLPPGFRQSQGPFALAGSLTRPAGMTIALSTVLTGQKEERKDGKEYRPCNFCFDISSRTVALLDNKCMSFAKLRCNSLATGLHSREQRCAAESKMLPLNRVFLPSTLSRL